MARIRGLTWSNSGTSLGHFLIECNFSGKLRLSNLYFRCHRLICYSSQAPKHAISNSRYHKFLCPLPPEQSEFSSMCIFYPAGHFVIASWVNKLNSIHPGLAKVECVPITDFAQKSHSIGRTEDEIEMDEVAIAKSYMCRSQACHGLLIQLIGKQLQYFQDLKIALHSKVN